MNKYPDINAPVKVLSFIGKEFENDKEGKVISRDGEYILIELNKSKVQVERYLSEIEKI